MMGFIFSPRRIRASRAVARPGLLRSLANLKIARKLALAFVVVVAGVLGMCGIVMVGMQRLDASEQLNAGTAALVDAVNGTQLDMLDQMASIRAYIITQDPALLDREKDRRDKFDRDLDTANRFAAVQPQLLPMLDALKLAHDGWQTDVAEPQIRFAGEPATRDKAVNLVKSSLSKLREKDVRGKADVVLRAARSWAEIEKAAAVQARTTIKATLLGGGALAVGLSALMGWVLSRAICRPVLSMTSAMSRLAAGDNGVEVPAVGRKDEVGLMAVAVQTFKDGALEKLRLEDAAASALRQAGLERAEGEAVRTEAARRQGVVVDALAKGLSRLADGDLVFHLTDPFAPDYDQLRTDFNRAVATLQDTMAAILRDTTAIRSGTDEISTATDDLPRRTEQQAASLEETAAALDQITATVRKTAEGAVHARDVVGVAKTDAESSGRVVREAIDAMSGIEQSSRQIVDIISVIDEIAFQTNLLALNAGVEAARAGDAGRGFAVVASEVRALAQRSAGAAREIKTLITRSTQQVASGVSLVSRTGVALDHILVQVAEISGIVADIAASAQEQTSALVQVNVAINQMDQVTQQNAAMVEETTVASHNLAHETEALVGLLGRFRVDDAPPRIPPATAPRRPDRTVAALKPVGRGGAAVKPQAAAEDWQEF